jgi:hypothetical protein
MAKSRYLVLGILVILAITLTVFVTACGSGGEETGPQPTSGPKVPATETPVPPPTATPTPTSTPTPTPTPLPDPTFPMKSAHFSYGVCADLYYREDLGVTAEDVMTYVDDLGVEWVRVQTSWADLEPAKGTYVWENLDPVVAAVGGHNRKILLSIIRSPAWAAGEGGCDEAGRCGMPADPNDLGDFLFEMVTHYGGSVQAYEIWNEQNYAVENAGYVSGAGRYVELLKVAYVRIKEANPYAFVLFGPLTPTGVNDPNIAIDDITYLREVYEYNGGEVKSYFDVLAAHTAGVHNRPDQLWPDNPGSGPGWIDHPTFYFRHVENIRQVMVDYGDDQKQIWLTEFGWASLEGIAETAAPGYEYAQYNSAVVQADYLPWALDIGRTKYQPWLGAMFVWNLNYSTFNPGVDEKSPFSLLRPDWGTRPSFRSVQAYIAEHPTWP